MPIYFAYGANMDVAAMGQRCPASRPVGPARLMNHRFFITDDGYASIRRWPGAVVHGLLWDLALSDVRPLDRFEDVASGLYSKLIQPVVKTAGTARALVYVGRSMAEGPPRPGYLEAILASAEALGLPEAYRRSLASLLPGSRSHSPAEAEALRSGPVVGVRPRFATPFDRT